jgi:hypothetical protein
MRQSRNQKLRLRAGPCAAAVRFLEFREPYAISVQEKTFDYTTDEIKGVKFLRKVRKHKPGDTASYSEKLYSSNRFSLHVCCYSLRRGLFQIFDLTHFQNTVELHLSGSVNAV